MRCCSVSLGKRAETVAGHACVNASSQTYLHWEETSSWKQQTIKGIECCSFWPLGIPNSITLGSQTLRWSFDSATARRMQTPQDRVLLEAGLHERRKGWKTKWTDNLDCPSPSCPWVGTTTTSKFCTSTSSLIKANIWVEKLTGHIWVRIELQKGALQEVPAHEKHEELTLEAFSQGLSWTEQLAIRKRDMETLRKLIWVKVNPSDLAQGRHHGHVCYSLLKQWGTFHCRFTPSQYFQDPNQFQAVLKVFLKAQSLFSRERLSAGFF